MTRRVEYATLVATLVAATLALASCATAPDVHALDACWDLYTGLPTDSIRTLCK